MVATPQQRITLVTRSNHKSVGSTTATTTHARHRTGAFRDDERGLLHE